MCTFLLQLRNATNLGTVPTATKSSSVPTNVRVGPVAIVRKVIMLRLLKNVQLPRYLSTAARPAPERNPAILYAGVSIVSYCACVYIESLLFTEFLYLTSTEMYLTISCKIFLLMWIFVKVTNFPKNRRFIFFLHITIKDFCLLIRCT